MIYLEFKNSAMMYLKKAHYVKALAWVIKGLRWIIIHKDPEIDIDFKIIFK